MRVFAILLLLCLQACIFSGTSPAGPCGDGEYEFTRFHAYNAMDSISAIYVVDAAGDTTSKDFYEYDAFGNLTRQIWVYKNLNPAGDTSCHGFERLEGGGVVRGYPCENPDETFSMDYRDSLGRTARITLFIGDSIFTQLRNEYNEQNQLVNIFSKDGSGEYLQMTNAFNEDGSWKASLQFDSHGQILWKTVMLYEGDRKSTTQVFDGEGHLSRWELNDLNSRHKPDKSIACRHK